MDNSYKEKIDLALDSKAISEDVKDLIDRINIVKLYRVTGQLYRQNAINMIMDLQKKDFDMQLETTICQISRGAVDLSMADNETIVENLLLQIGYLETKIPIEIYNNIIKKL